MQIALNTCSNHVFKGQQTNNDESARLVSWQGVEVEPNNPHVFWSAAEDGIVRQYDTRLSANSQKAWESSNCLLSVKATGPASSNRSVELKGISLNKVLLLPCNRQQFHHNLGLRGTAPRHK